VVTNTVEVLSVARILVVIVGAGGGGAMVDSGALVCVCAEGWIVEVSLSLSSNSEPESSESGSITPSTTLSSRLPIL